MKLSKCIRIFLFLFLLSFAKGFEPFPRLPVNGPCEGIRQGDCDPDVCLGEENSCEARYSRFWDASINGDREKKSCQCAEESICHIIGMHSFSGCRSYMSLSTQGQKFIREWSLSPAERIKRRQYLTNVSINRTTPPFLIDKIRHSQLQNGNTRFCCKTSKKRRRYIAAAQLNKSPQQTTTVSFCFYTVIFFLFNL
uniref:Uncharacterized protein n=1 Tax=Panagrolaimus sp. PS1159 TaxID=55785 RepID=A0AC35F0Z3_9BILA